MRIKEINTKAIKILQRGVLLMLILGIKSTLAADSSINEEQPLFEQPLTLKKGQVLTLAMPVTKPGAENIVKQYGVSAFPLAREYGLKSLFNLKVKQTFVGDIKPPVVALFSWPDSNAEKGLTRHPKWAGIKQLRSQGWAHLNIFNTELLQDINVTFRSDKFYTIVVAWFDKQNANDYLKYLHYIEKALNEVGGRFFIKLNHPQFETLTNTWGQPGQITFVEWPAADGFQKLQKHPEYQANRHLFGSGLKHFEFYGLQLEQE